MRAMRMQWLKEEPKAAGSSTKDRRNQNEPEMKELFWWS
jgi:hypothetical protein